VAFTRFLVRKHSLVGLAAATTAAAVACAVVLPTVAGATPAQPSTPATISSVTAKLATLARQDELVTEAVNLAQADLVAKQAAAASAAKYAVKERAAFTLARNQLGLTVAARYESETFSGAGALFTSDSGQQYLDKVTTMSLLTQHRTAQIVALSATKASADSATKQAATLLTAAVAKQKDLTKQKAVVEANTTKFKAQLASLTLAEQLAFKARNAPPKALIAAMKVVPVGAGNSTAPVNASTKAANPSAQAAVNFALAQLGKPYVTDAAGPSTFDCSGLTMRAWEAGGVSLPHNAAAQYGYGTHVAFSQLQPGDLIFLYQPIGHVEIYVGNNLAVSAPEPGDVVKYVDVRTLGGDYVGATRLT
jgi:peptidoglycan DL-endopeptidase CwlO